MIDDCDGYATVKTREDIEELLEARVEWLRQLRNQMSDDDFLRIVASVFVQSRLDEFRIAEYQQLIKDHEFALGVFSGKANARVEEVRIELLKFMDESGVVAAKSLLRGLNLAQTALAKKGAKTKLANDPKQKAKARVKECWIEWQLKPTNYKGKSAFAKDMMAKFEELDSQAVITRWCSQWEKEAASKHSVG